VKRTLAAIVALLAVLILAGTACAEQASITIYPGENWISVPLVPYNYQPSVLFAGCNINGNLVRLDPTTGATITYSAAHPDAFGGILLGDGYKLICTTPAPVVISYEGFPDGVPDLDPQGNPIAGTMTDMWISLPGRQGDGQNAGGSHWIGCPFNHARPVDACKVTDGTTLLNLAQAVQQGWIDGLWDSMNNESKATVKVGLSTMSPDESTLLPGRMYQVVTHKDDLALIIPGNVPEPSTILALLCGLGGLAGLKRRRL